MEVPKFEVEVHVWLWVAIITKQKIEIRYLHTQVRTKYFLKVEGWKTITELLPPPHEKSEKMPLDLHALLLKTSNL